MDYARGRQVILHDPRLFFSKTLLPGPPSEEEWWLNRVSVAPRAWSNIEVDPKTEKVADVFGLVAVRGNIAKLLGVAQLDALHIMAHGNQGSIQIGKDSLHRPTMSALGKIAGMFRYLVIHSCLVGNPPVGSPAFATFTTFGGSLFARTAAALTKASVVVARQNQAYSVRKPADPGKAELDFGDWEGPVDVYEDGASTLTYNRPIDGKLDLEKLIFGSAK